MSGSLKKGVCLVAGAGPGIGQSVAKKFARYVEVLVRYFNISLLLFLNNSVCVHFKVPGK